MSTSPSSRPFRVGVIFVTIAAAVLGVTFDSAFASRSETSSSLPCKTGGPDCINIGFTDAWFNGDTVQLEYSHRFFCSEPPSSEAPSGCEAGDSAATAPPSGPVVSEIYMLVPLGFSAPSSKVQCGARCIDQPSTMDLSRIGGDDEATFTQRSFVIEDAEAFQSTWWPVVVVGVKNLNAWNHIASEKTIDAVDACQAAGGCMQEAESNAFLFFQVLGPGMSPQGPA
jgi:hypothetical protein